MAPGSFPEWGELEQVLLSAGVSCSVPTAHGLLTGCLVADASLSGTHLEQVLGQRRPVPDGNADAFHRTVEALRLSVLRALNDTDLGFEPLLPDDGEDLVVRTHSLGQWVDGFLGGIGQTPRVGGLKPSAEAVEILRDFAEIARIDTEPEESEDSERALAELNEYVRIGVMLLADELAPAQPRSRIPLQ